jgi:putative Holliday junction resolvase
MSPPKPSDLARAGRILGLDIGDRRIGLAVSIPPGDLILPAGYLERRNRRSDIAAILEQARQRDAVAIVAGMPYDAHGQSGDQARKTATLVRALQRTTNIPVLTVDESFSSNAAVNDLLQSGQSPSRDPGAVDAAAAAAILRRFLDS